MPNALIVDDSKTARYALRQLLDKQQIAADMVESAEQALDYLRENAPDLIFMDHMMPGMDGFEAVKLIKANPVTTHIPIVMYTSTQGGVYFGQARALGAADVIAKPATAQELQDVLRRIEEKRRRTAATEGAAVAASAAASPLEAAPPAEVAPAPAPERERPAPRVTSVAPPVVEPDHVAPAPPAPRRRLWLLALLSAAAALVLSLLYADALAANRALVARQAAALEALQWALGAEEYPYDEAPFAGDRLTRLQELLVHLQAIGFHGQVVMESHVGEFCLVPAGSSGETAEWMPASGELPITGCTALGQSREQSRRLGQEQSAAFQRFLERSPLLADGALAVQLVTRGADEPLEAYPVNAAVSAAVWNAVAQRNQRVTFELVPSR